MTRANDKPFDCKDCRFNIKNRCRRNPPSGAEIVQYRGISDTSPQIADPGLLVVGVFLPVGEGCFAGEPIVKRSCTNCGVEDCRVFLALDNHTCGEVSLDDLLERDWHCRDWKAAE